MVTDYRIKRLTNMINRKTRILNRLSINDVETIRLQIETIDSLKNHIFGITQED